MKFLSLTFALLCVCMAQDPLGGGGRGGTHPDLPDPEIRLPRSQRSAIIKADHKKNVEDATALLKLAEELKIDLEKQDESIISIRNIKQAEDIQKLAKNIHGRLKRY